MATRLFALLLLALTVATVTGCNTVHGIGSDIEAAGSAIKRSTR